MAEVGYRRWNVEKGDFMITYEKLFAILEQRGISQNEAIKKGIFNHRSLNALKHNKNVNIATIERICTVLDIEPADILTFTKGEPATMSKENVPKQEQQLMLEGMDMLLKRFNIRPDDTMVSVAEIIKASNEVYDEIILGKGAD